MSERKFTYLLTCNHKNNTSNSKENNTLITKFNYAVTKEEKVPVLKKALLRQNSNLEKYPQKNQVCSPKLKDGKSTRELESNNSPSVTRFIQNPSKFWMYVTNACKLQNIFTNFFNRFVFLIIFFSFLFRNCTIVDEPPFNVNFYNYTTIARIFSHFDYIDVYDKYFFKHEALRIDLENRHITLYSKNI